MGAFRQLLPCFEVVFVRLFFFSPLAPSRPPAREEPCAIHASIRRAFGIDSIFSVSLSVRDVGCCSAGDVYLCAWVFGDVPFLL